MLQRAAVRCRVLQRVAACCRVLQCVALYSSVSHSSRSFPSCAHSCAVYRFTYKQSPYIYAHIYIYLIGVIVRSAIRSSHKGLSGLYTYWAVYINEHVHADLIRSVLALLQRSELHSFQISFVLHLVRRTLLFEGFCELSHLLGVSVALHLVLDEKPVDAGCILSRIPSTGGN